MNSPEFPSDLQPWAIVSGDRRPETAIQALLEAAPGDTPSESVEELQPIREAVADCMDRLSDESKFVLDAVMSERLSYAELAERLGCSKSKAHGLVQHAMAALRVHLIHHPLIRERLDMPNTWNSACYDALLDMAPDTAGRHESTLEVIAVITQQGELLVDAVQGWLIHGNLANWQDDIHACITNIGRYAALMLARQGRWNEERLNSLLCSKQADYGHENILAFGVVGVGVRLHDKIARLKNLLGTTAKPKNESMHDTFDDLVGYAVIARMLHNNTFILDLEMADV